LASSDDEDDENDVQALPNSNDDDSVMSDNSGSVPTAAAGEGNTATQFGRTVCNVDRLTYDVKGIPKQEFNLVGAGIGGEFINPQELHAMKYDKAMATPDVKEWENILRAISLPLTDKVPVRTLQDSILTGLDPAGCSSGSTR
jgi:hypothetical protein